MKRYSLYAALLLAVGCSKQSNGTWDAAQTSSNTRKTDQSLWGNDDEIAKDVLPDPKEEDFIPLKEEDLQGYFADGSIPQSKVTPGESGSGVPSIEQFVTPSGTLAHIFQNLYFNTDDYILKGAEPTNGVEKIAAYLKAHPTTYLFIAGHCDERGPEAYNLALGARRANYIRSALIKRGVDMNQIFTVSYGKEKPSDTGHTSSSWAKNRRAEFKLYHKTS